MIYSYNEFLFESKSFRGKEVWKYISEITPDEEDVPYGFKDLIISHTFNVVYDFDLKSLLKTDSDFLEYYNAFDDNPTRYYDDEVNHDDLYLNITVVDGILLDGYNRSCSLLKKGESTTHTFVAIN
jgi:hypothetical protein